MVVVLALVFLAGCIGGFVNSLVAGELQLPKRDEEANVLRPGWLGNVFLGGVAAVVFWGLYGPLAGYTLIGEAAARAGAALTLSEFIGFLVTGIGGGRLLNAEVDRRALQNQNEALGQTKNSLADAIEALVAQREGG